MRRKIPPSGKIKEKNKEKKEMKKENPSSRSVDSVGSKKQSKSWSGLLLKLGFIVGVIVFAVYFIRDKESKTHDFGVISTSDVVRHEFKVANNSSEPLHILRVTASCDCTTVKRFSPRILAGSQGVFYVELKPNGPGALEVELEVEFKNASNRSYYLKAMAVADAEKTSQIAQAEAKIDRLRKEGFFIGAALLRTQWGDKRDKRDKKDGQASKELRELKIVDTRSAYKFQLGHIPNSLNMPIHRIRSSSFLKNKDIVIVDNGHASESLMGEVKWLRENGFKSVKVLEGGIRSWKNVRGKLNGVDLKSPSLASLSPVQVREVLGRKDWNIVYIGAKRVKKVSVNPEQEFSKEIKQITYRHDKKSKKAFLKELEKAFGTEGSGKGEGVGNIRPKLLIASLQGENYQLLERDLGNFNQADVFYLDGGLLGYREYFKKQNKKGVSQRVVLDEGSSSYSRSNFQIRKPAGCASCP